MSLPVGGLGHGFDGCAVGGSGAFGRGMPAAREGGAVEPAPDAGRDRVAVRERGQVAEHPGRAWPVVDGGADVHPLGAARGMGAPARPRPGAGRRTRDDVPGRHRGAGARQGGGAPQKGVWRSTRSAWGAWPVPWRPCTKAVVIADAGGRAVAFGLAPGPSARACPRRPLARPPAGRAALGRGRPRLLLPRVPRAGLEPRRTARDPAQAQRGAGELPGLHLRQPQPRRAPPG